MSLEPTLTREHYLSPQAFALEKERIFCREWMCVGRESELTEEGDYLVIDLAGESLLLVRSAQGLHGHYNVCRHRGSQLIPVAAPLPGEARADGRLTGRFSGGIRCPYHAWTYRLDGQLRTAPFLDESAGLCKDDLSLFAVGVETWGGFLFVNLDPEPARAAGRTLQAQLGGIPERVQRYPLGELRPARRIGYEVAANWKVILENYNECYHCGPVHPELCRVVPAFRQRGGAELDWERGVPHREGAWTFTMSGTTTRRPFSTLNDDERVRHKGELLYPNFMCSLSADHAACFTLWPRDAGETTILCDFLFHPDEMARPDFDPSDAIELWDITNRQDWAICESVQRGMGSRVFKQGLYAPMENLSLDIRRYIQDRLHP
ncbi:MAG TPA: aromatic ring-hydroxylating dioxygenase subunit alpha [Gemmatimonadales bacterium]|nr:aromatic ring-hydroxylating dioxygenase subunit alpha [Gemmatimonadales bacterium]